MTDSPIQHVSDTARWVAVYRAMESERPDAVFHDPYARRLAGQHGETIVRGMKDGVKWAWPMVIRTAVMDEIILRLAGQGLDLVVNLAAGLDARPWRLALPPALRWVDVDFPDMLDYKTRTLAGERPVCVYEPRPADLANAAERRAVLAAAASGARAGLVITEGLLVYLDEAQVAALGRDAHAQPGLRWWLTDLASPGLKAFLDKSWGHQLARGNAPMKFFPPQSTGFFEPLGWREIEWRETWDEGRRLNRRMKLAWLFDILQKLQSRRKREAMKKFAGIALLQRI